MNIKILTVFSPGSYGTYLSWAVNSYSNLNISREIHKPFGNNGSAHLYRRDLDKKKVKPSHLINEDYKNIIFIRPTNFLDYLDNQYAKQAEYDDSKFINGLMFDFEEKIKTHWGIKDISKVSKWENRELWSFFLPEHFMSIQRQYSEYESILTHSNNNVVYINAENILYHHLDVINQIFLKFKLEKIVNDDTILNLHNEYMGLQKHLNKTEYVNTIVDDCINGKYKEIANLSVYDEAMIQYLFRERGFELQCYNLNEFPKNTAELRKILTNPAN